MGVGLSISRSIVENHGGQMRVEPNNGGGTVFRFTLPSVTSEELHDGNR
jgi:two-component system sensor kinase FixL